MLAAGPRSKPAKSALPEAGPQYGCWRSTILALGRMLHQGSASKWSMEQASWYSYSLPYTALDSRHQYAFWYDFQYAGYYPISISHSDSTLEFSRHRFRAQLPKCQVQKPVTWWRGLKWLSWLRFPCTEKTLAKIASTKMGILKWSQDTDKWR